MSRPLSGDGESLTYRELTVSETGRAEPRVGILTLNRPARRNALDAGLRRALGEQLQALSTSPPAVLILTGSGAHFCAGGDIEDMRAADFSLLTSRRRLTQEYHPLVRGLVALDCPVVAAIDGCCFGAGFSLALACDYLLCSNRARFGLSFLRLGVVPDCGAFHILPRIVGAQRAKALMLSTRELDAAEVFNLGICAEVTLPETLQGRAREVASQLALASPVAMRAIKKGVQLGAVSSLDEVLAFEAQAQAECRSTAHHQDAVRAFLEKRPPAYRGIAYED